MMPVSFERLFSHPVATSHAEELALDSASGELRVRGYLKEDRYQGVFSPFQILSCHQLLHVDSADLDASEGYLVMPRVNIEGMVDALTGPAGGLWDVFGTKPSVKLEVYMKYRLFSGGMGNPRTNIQWAHMWNDIINIDDTIWEYRVDKDPQNYVFTNVVRALPFFPDADRDLHLQMTVSLHAFLKGSCWIAFSRLPDPDPFSISVPEVLLIGS